MCVDPSRHRSDLVTIVDFRQHPGVVYGCQHQEPFETRATIWPVESETAKDPVAALRRQPGPVHDEARNCHTCHVPSVTASQTLLNGPQEIESTLAKSFNVVDLFCGTGAIAFGLTQADSSFQVVGGIDSNDAACMTAQKNHPGSAMVNAPINSFTPERFAAEIGATTVDMIVGGPPCQGFSSLRPSRGTTLDDPRNSLYREYAKYVAALAPRVFLMENVVGLVNATHGGLLLDIVRRFERAGYRTDWRILNAANYGVPQKRERFFLIGVRRDVKPGLEITFPEPTHHFRGRTIGIRDRSRRVINEFSGLPAVSAWQAMSDLPSICSGKAADHYDTRPKNAYQRKMRTASKSLSLHTAADHNKKMLTVIKHAGSSRSALPDGLVSSGYSSCYSRIDPNEPAPTITVKFTSPASSKCIHPYDDRAITPREAARLQSFPDHFEFAGSKTEIAGQLGNAVPPSLAACLAPSLSRYL